MFRRTAVVLVLSFCCLAQSKPAQPDLARMEQVIQSYASNQRFMGTIIVAQDGKTLLDKGYGSADLEWNIPNSPTTKFRLGSITKQFTAASILMLEERGKLKTNDLVKKYMPDAPAAWDKMTIFHVLTHTAGIPNFTSFPDYESTQALPTTPEKLVARFKDKPLDFEPGTKWSYSNSGYVLLGYLIEKVSGQNYEEFVQQNIFTLLGMKDSGYDSNSAVIVHRASGYAPGKNGPENAGFVHMSVPFSAGALYSTTEDLLLWEQGLFGGKVLKPESLAKMTTPFKDDYALGLGVTTRNGHKVFSHGGGIQGFNTMLAYYPDDKLTVAVLANVNGPAAGELGTRLAQIVLGEKVVLPSERKEISVAQAVLAKYPGTYELAPNFSMVITLEDGTLMAQATNQRKRPVFPESETLFFSKDIDAQLEFFRNDKGEVTHLVLHQGGRDTKGTKK